MSLILFCFGRPSALQALESEKKRFSALESDMKKRCADLETELTTLRTSTLNSSSLSVGVQATDCGMDEEIFCSWQKAAETTSQMSCDEEEYDIDDVIEELNNIVNSAESDMNTEKDTSSSCNTSKNSGSFIEEHVVIPKYIPRPPPRPESKRSVVRDPETPTGVHLDADLTGETSDFPMTGVNTPESNPISSDSEMERGPTEISRKKITQNFFRQSDDDEEGGGDDDDDKDFDRSVCESDWGKTQILRRNIRKSFRSTGDESRGRSTEELSEDKIKPDILRAIPNRLFHKSWDVLEARSPMYSDDMVLASSGHDEHVMSNRRRHASVDNLSSIQRDSPIFVHPMVHHPNVRDPSAEEMMMFEQHHQQRFLMGHHSPLPYVYRHPEHFHDPTLSPIDPAAHLGDLQVGDVFSFPGQYSGVRSGPSRNENRKHSKRQELDSSGNSKSGSRNSFGFSNLIPGFFKSSFGSSSRDSSSKSSREEWDTFQSEKALTKDYRQNFYPHQPIPPAVLRHPNDQHFDMNPAEFWPPSFQAMPFRNIPQQFNTVDPSRIHRPSDQMRVRSNPLSSPTIQKNRDMHHNNINRIAKLLDHPSGMYWQSFIYS